MNVLKNSQNLKVLTLSKSLLNTLKKRKMKKKHSRSHNEMKRNAILRSTQVKRTNLSELGPEKTDKKRA